MDEIEKDYWWYKAKRRQVADLVRRFTPKKKMGDWKMLDVGCGTGCMLRDLKRYGKGYGVDISEEAVKYCRRRKVGKMKVGDVTKVIPFREKFDLVTILDVIEHIEDDEAVLRKIRGAMEMGGILVLTTSAFPRLWSYWDEVAGHYRRYTWNELKGKVQGAGFEVIYLNYTNMATLFPAVILRWLKSRFFRSGVDEVESDFVRLPKYLNEFLVVWMGWEAWLARWVRLPFGLSYMLVARKRD